MPSSAGLARRQISHHAVKNCAAVFGASSVFCAIFRHLYFPFVRRFLIVGDEQFVHGAAFVWVAINHARRLHCGNVKNRALIKLMDEGGIAV